MDDLISRRAAVDALGKPPKFKISLRKSYEEGRNDQWFDDVSALSRVPSAQPEADEWCADCKEYDHDKHCCPRWNRVIRTAIEEAQPERKKGRWIRITQGATPEKYMCPFCHRTVEHEGVEYFVSMMYPFCHCGADMRGGEGAVN